MKRTHMCAEVTEEFLNKRVTVKGWVYKRRNLGQLIFISLRDRTGLVQIVIDQKKNDLFELAQKIHPEFVIEATGRVIARTEKNINPEMITGKIEIAANDLKILSSAEIPPFNFLDEGVKEDLRLKYMKI